ncbi:hypothetical protein Ddc_11619 [Ditylenchus destructor]|nr:hypothetical protein Ddc_11619 [Ditylenchus destructor]
MSCSMQVIEKIKKEFLESTNAYRLKVIIQTDDVDDVHNLYLRSENNCTGEVLELKNITNEEVENSFDVIIHYGFNAFILERYSI